MLSDIHANLEALDAVLATLEPDDALLCLGDTIGYGPDPNACVARLRERGAVCVLGNHDVAVVDGFGTDFFNDQAREAVRWTQGVLDPAHRAWLDELAYELRLPEFLLVHGAPVRYFEYCRDVEAARRAFANTDAPLVFVGHTHVAECYALSPEGGISQAHLQRGGVRELEPGFRYVVNVGSVGQPRDLNPEAAYVLFEPEARRVTWRRLAYDVEAVVAKIAAAGLPASAGQRLRQGR